MRTGGKCYAIDTNVILRYLLRDHEELAAKAKSIIDAVDSEALRVWCNPIILAEVVFVMSHHYGILRKRIVENLTPIVEMPSFIVPGKELILEALRLYARSVPHFGDACVCASATSEAGGKLLSFDRRLSGVEGITRLESVE